MKFSQLVASGLALGALVLATPAAAHELSAWSSGFAAGIAHPFTGFDHVLAMIAVGLWAAELGGRARWALPAGFVAVMAMGGALPHFGIVLPMVESSVATSVLVLGLIITMSARLALPAAIALVGAFAIFHGHAHTAELPESVGPLYYGAGFIVATALLHATGVVLGTALQRRHAMLVPAGGVCIAAAGLGLLVLGG
jgi:urease accessory protein